jgi:uncharacterized protein
MRRYLIIILLLLSVATAHAASGHITLLTVADDAESTGGTADLYLTTKPGTGAVYIDSYPLTRVDTQSSVRYANQIACDMLQADCTDYDFFYTIRANSAIVGGPSAGAAMAVLTVAVLDGEDLDQHIAMTGTINSGGVIGPVAGITAKVKGAKAAGITRVLIPSLISDAELMNGSLNISENASVEQQPLRSGRVDYLSDDKIAVIRVGTVEEALYEFTGENYSRKLKPLETPDEYTKRMRQIAIDICNRTTQLRAQISYNDTHNYTQRMARLPADHEYSRASTCFSMNIELAALILQNKSAAERQEVYLELRKQAKQLDDDVRGRTLLTIGDLETYAITKERIIEAQQLLNNIESSDPDAQSLAYAQERLVSARSWSGFFAMPGQELRFDQAYLQRACLAKLSEAEERINYVRLYVPTIVAESERLLEDARDYSQDEPILCIFTASKAKAQANLLANAITIGRENIDALIQQKTDADWVVLQKQQEKGFFPILGYSYTQYAMDLRPDSPYSALTFAEYALELSNLDIYFPKEQHLKLPPGFTSALLLFAFGSVFGAAVATIILRKPRKRRP